jgi:hypothetical protein
MTTANPSKSGIIAQIRTAARNPLPSLIGALLGALVPAATFTVGHHELTSWTEPKALIVLGGLVFSALTVFRWGRLAFGSAVKAFGFVVLAEGVMTFCSTEWLSMVALGYLVMINAIATGCAIALGAAEDAAPAAAPSLVAPSVALDVAAPFTAALTGLESRLAAPETPPLAAAPAPAKRARKRTAKKQVSRQLAIPVALRAEDLLGAYA